MNTDGSGTGDFSTYAGPVLPMTSLGGAEGVEVTRSVDFDFSPYESGGEYSNLGRAGWSRRTGSGSSRTSFPRR